MTTTNTSILGRLRAVTPHRVVTFGEALRVAELQASKLSELLGVDDGIRDFHIGGLPRITVTYENLDVSGMSHWNGYIWIITISKHDSLARQRFTLLHEFKHIIDHGRSTLLYAGDRNRSAAQQSEVAADYFAGCALVSKRQLKSAWGFGIQRPDALAAHFGVSEQAIRVRLAQTGLDIPADHEASARCARPVSTPHYQTQKFKIAQPAYPRRTYV